jgi:FkbM family methyltransferase
MAVSGGRFVDYTSCCDFVGDARILEAPYRGRADWATRKHSTMPGQLTTAAKKSFLAATDLWRTVRLTEIPPKDRFRLARTAILAWLRVGSADVELTFPRNGKIYFQGNSLNSDWNTFSEIFLSRCYATDYEGSLVLDVGAHKGFYGAFVLLNGAREVRSFEPESVNYAHLERAAESFRTHSHMWKSSKQAVGAERTNVELHVSGESWTHSLLPLPSHGNRRQIAAEKVEMVPLDTLIGEDVDSSRRVIVKIDVEGTECEAVLGTKSWQHVNEVFIETHPFASCSQDAIIRHLELFGLQVQRDTTAQIAHLKRREDA